MQKKPFLPNLDPLIRSGYMDKILQAYGQRKECLAGEMKKIIRIVDETDAISRYTWYNLPLNMTSGELERLLYYYGDLCLFYFKPLKRFLVLPYAGEEIDIYGRFKYINPVPFATEVDKEQYKAQQKLLGELHLEVLYGIPDEPIKPDDLTKYAILISDYPHQLPQKIIPRYQLNDTLLDIESEIIPMARTARLLSTGIKGVRVNDEDAAENVEDANRAIENASLEGKPYIPITSSVEMQELEPGSTTKGEEFMLALQSLDNFRLGTYGIENGGIFNKKAHELNAEQALNNSPVTSRLVQGSLIRQNTCNIANAVFDLGIWCEIAEEHSMIDVNGDGIPYTDNNDSSNTGIENEGGESDE